MAGASAEINHRQRKQVYMHSTIFDDAGPSSGSVYAASKQNELYANLQPNLRNKKGAPPPEMTMPSPADIRATQNAGNGVVMESGSTAGYPGGFGDLSVVMAGQKHDDSIPREFWNTSVNVDWKDPRNEMRRGKDREAMGHGDRKREDLSSEIFGNERLLQASTMAPKRELMAFTAEPLRTDSALERKSATHDRDQGGYAKDRFYGNLATNTSNTMCSEGPVAMNPGSTPQEDPMTMHRRRGEKNYSDLFGTSMPEREKGNQREELHGTRVCSFLDTRGEIASRNQQKWKVDDDSNFNVHQTRKDAELDSTLFEYQRPVAPRTSPNANDERPCWDTRDIMAPGSEIARRRRMKAFEDGADNAQSRRKAELSGGQIREGMGQGPPSPRPAEGQSAGRRVQRPEPVNAKQTKQAFLQSSIFS